MSTRLKGIYTRLRAKGAPAGHGNAGLASNFIDLAHAKVKPGGVLALVLPSAFVNGSSWGPARALLQREYEDLAVLTIAAHGSTDRAFSADTGMAEALVVATKRRGPRQGRESALFVNLRHRPRSLAEAFEMAQAVRRLPPKHQGQLRVGTHEIVGTYIRAPLNQGGCAALRETTLAETAIDLTRTGSLRLPRGFSARLPTVALAALGEKGLVHRDISGFHPDGTPQGPSTSSRFRGWPLSIRACGTTTPAGSRASWSTPTPKGWHVPTARTAPQRSGGRRPRSCTSPSTSSSTPRPWPPASRRRRPSAGGRGQTSCRHSQTGSIPWSCGPTPLWGSSPSGGSELASNRAGQS